MLGAVRLSLAHYRASAPLVENAHLITFHAIEQATETFDLVNANLAESLRKLRQRVDQLNLIYDITSQLNDQVSINQVIELTLDALWQKAPLRFAVVILGDTELGPYRYQDLRGVSDAWRFAGKECPFPLWGVLARALIPQLDPARPDYLIVHDIRAEHRPLPEEFPWMELEGSLMILPLRIQKTVTGALLLGRNEVNGFSDGDLCEDYVEIAKSAARALQLAQIHQELQERVSQLVGLQLLTRSLTNIKYFDEMLHVLTQSFSEIAGKATVALILDSRFIRRSNVESLLSSSENSNFSSVQLTVRTVPLHENQQAVELSPHILRLVEWAMQAGQPVFYDPQENSENPEQFYYNESGHGLLVPIVNHERTIGVIHVVAPDRPQRFDEGDMVILRTIANTVAVMLNHISASAD
ncbi:MAG: GAF domain-containing protein [Caldilineaceae bacterium]